MSDEIRTCALSLLAPGVCCTERCTATASYAVLMDHGAGLVEHTRCGTHVQPEYSDFVDVKPLQWNPLWGPKSAGDWQTWKRTKPLPNDAVMTEEVSIEVNDEGKVRISEAVLGQLLLDAGWERTA